MSANHNRIRVADLEKNQPDKILITNQNGELEFSNISKLQTTYNALDYTTEGKALDARQGKVLKDLIDNVNVSPTVLVNDLTTGGTSKALTAEMGKTLDNTKLTASLATDAEAQMTIAVPEDKKVVSRLKLFNWWEWVKTKSQTILGTWTFKSSLICGTSGYLTTDSLRLYVRAFTGKRLQIGVEGVPNDAISIDSSGIFLYDKITLRSGLSSKPSFVLPSGILTTIPQNGAIERDENGQLWETHGGVRSRLITTSDSLITLAYKSINSIQTNLDQAISSTIEAASSSTTIGKINNVSVLRLNAVNQLTYFPIGVIKPTVAKVEVFLKINNGLFATHFSGSNPTSQVKIMEFSGTNMTGNKDYQNTVLTNIQNSNPVTAQWSTITFFLQTYNDDLVTKKSKEYYLRDALNSRTFGAAEASFSFVFVNTLVYDDAQNSAGQNAKTLLRNTNYALYFETIK